MRRSPVVDATFVVRVCLDREGRMTGTVELVRTGEKQRVHGPEEIGGAIARMAERRKGVRHDGVPAHRVP